MPRRTKIIATIGPASDSPPVLRRLVEAGMDVARIGLAHGTLDDAMARYRAVRAVAAELQAPVGVLVDLPGPKVRLGTFGDTPVRLDTGSPLTLVPGLDTSDTAVLGVDYGDLLLDVHAGDCLAVGDGSVVLRVESIDGDSAKATVLHGGPVQGRPGLHIPSDRLSMSTPTPEDLRLVDAFVDEGVDMVAISFVRSAHDIRRSGTEPHPRGPLIVAKIEMANAILFEAALSFLGLGVQPPLPSWGLMLAEAKSEIFFAPWMITIPGAALFTLVLMINLLGDGFRDAFAAETRL